jgi:hypothetical protein
VDTGPLTLVAQPANPVALFVYLLGDYDPSGGLQPETVGRVLAQQGVASAHLVTAGRSPQARCLVVSPTIPVLPVSALSLQVLCGLLADLLGASVVRFARPLEQRGDPWPHPWVHPY